jgi:hypothetical protein
MSIKKIIFSLFLLATVSIAQAVTIAPIPTAGKTSMDKISKLYYLTFVSSSFNPQAATGTQQPCPAGSAFVNASSISIPSYPGLSLTPGSSGVLYMWQCTTLVNFWISKANGNMELDKTGLDPALHTLYTGFQFANNSYVPLGVGGSGLGCLSAGGASSVTCTASGTTMTPSGSSGKWLYYVQPGEALQCTIHRDYGSTAACSGSGCPCNGSYTVQPGSALIGACCNGTWKTAVTNFSDPNFNTCNFGC